MCKATLRSENGRVNSGVKGLGATKVVVNADFNERIAIFQSMDAETNNIAFLNLHRAQCPILPRDPPSPKGLGQQYEKS